MVSRLGGRLTLFVVIVAAGSLIFLLGLGRTGVVDETPALFAASARAMSESHDWLVPRVNGLPRYDKPPFVYWLMAAGYSLPGRMLWDPLGSLAARLPSALASIGVMLVLADTLRRWPQAQSRSGAGATAVRGAMAFALGPLALIWGRTEVSDALFSALLTLGLLLAWRSYAANHGPRWHWWPAIALATLTKGPVALILCALILSLFAALQGDRRRLVARLHPCRGLLLATLAASPWYLAVLLREGEAYGRSFFGYHNLQRFTRVVNNHQQSWWYFAAVLVLASLPFTPLLLLGLTRALRRLGPPAAPASLARFAACWLLVVLVFFSLSATKLPSYWLPATPAAALLVCLSITANEGRQDRAARLALAASAVLMLFMSAGLAAAPLWVPWIEDPSLPDLSSTLLSGPWLAVASLIMLFSALLAFGIASARRTTRLLQSQLALALVVPLVVLPLMSRLDRQRGEPIRRLSAVISEQRRQGESLAMVGLMKPSLHFYSHATVIYEGQSATALRNLDDRLRRERRPGLEASSAERQPTVLLVIDRDTVERRQWRDLAGRVLAVAEPYRLVRLERNWLEKRSRLLARSGKRLTWQDPRPERY